MKLDGGWKSRYGAYNFRCGQGRGDHYSIESLGKRGGRIFSESWEPAGVKNANPHIFTVEFDEGILRLAIDGMEIVSGFDQHPLALLSALSFNVEGPIEIRPLSLTITPSVLKRITLYHWDDTPLSFTAGDFIIWISEDNETYRMYRGPLVFNDQIVEKKSEPFTPAPEKRFGSPRSMRTYRFSDTDIDSRYMAIELRAESSGNKIENYLSAFVEIKNEKGERIPVTYGLSASMRFDPDAVQQRVGDFRKAGIAFDAGERTRYDRWTGGARLQQSLGRSRFSLEPGGWLGLAMGRNEFPTATVDPSFPEVRMWITEHVRKLMELGADGVDFRLVNHTESLDWENYGFSQPVVAEFGKRYGIDITRESFDRSLWGKLRGEYIDILLREISKNVHAYEGTFQIHIDPQLSG